MGKKRIGILWAFALISVLVSGQVWGQSSSPALANLPADISQVQTDEGDASSPMPVVNDAESLDAPDRPPIPTPPETSTPTPLLLPAATEDPAEQIAPPVIELSPGRQPISQVMALTMHQELSSLIGRFESAQLMAIARDQPASIAAEERLTASVNPMPASATSPVLAEARALLNQWFDLIEQGKYAIAQERWEAARQALWDEFPTDRPYAQPEIRAIWLDRGTIVAAQDRSGLAQVFDRLAQAGFNTVFFETVNAGFPIYPSRLAPQNPLTVQWNPLEAAVELAHQRNMELHAWVWTFAAGNRVHNQILNLPPDFDGPMLSVHPDWVGYDNRGSTIPPGQTKAFYDPANQELRTFLLRLFSEIISDYDVDGLQLDYIRYPFQDPGANRTYGYGRDARWRFMAATGIDPIELSPRPGRGASRSEQRYQLHLWERWTEFRTQQINTFVLEVSHMVRRQRPDITLSAAVFAKPEHERLQKIQQDWGTWAHAGYLDWIVLMSYAADTSRFEQLVEPWLVDQDFGSTLLLPSIRLLHLPRYGALDQMQAARDLPTVGYAVFAANDLTEELESVLAQTQGLGTDSLPLPQTDPYQVALKRYRALQQEWNWLFSEGYMWIEQEQRQTWITQVNQLEAQLQALAENSTARRLATVRSQLSAVLTSIDDDIAVGVTNSAYRIKTWRHRLTTLEKLLAYGEHS